LGKISIYSISYEIEKLELKKITIRNKRRHSSIFRFEGIAFRRTS